MNMMYKCCAKCQKIIPIECGTYCIDCATKVPKRRYKEYNNVSRNKDTQSFYNNKAWKCLAKDIKQTYNGLCMCCLGMSTDSMTANNIKPARIVHHIIPLSDNKDLGLRYDNLIPVCDRCHKVIHTAYDKDEHTKELMQDKLKEIISKNIFKG